MNRSAWAPLSFLVLLLLVIFPLAACSTPSQPAPTAAQPTPAAAKPTAAAPASPAAAPATAAPAPEKIGEKEIRVGWNPFFPSWPIQMAVVHDSFKKAGLKVTLSQFASPPQILEAMVAGNLDVGVGTGPNYITAREKGAKVVAVGLLAGMGHPPNTYFVRKAANIHSVKDLHGKTMAVNNYGGNYDLYLRYMLEQNGLDPKAEKIIELPDSATLQALSSGQIDMGVVSSSLAKQIETSLGDQVSALFTYTDIDLFKERVNGLILVMNESFSKDSRPDARAFMGVLAQEVDWINKNPKEALAAYADLTKNPAAAQQEKPNDFPDSMRLDIPSMQHDIDLAVKFGYAKTQFKAADIVDHSLIDEYLKSRK